MASFAEKDNLVISTVRHLNDLANDSYHAAKQTLDDLSDGIVDLPLSVINVDIASDIDVTWTKTIGSVGTISEPTYVDDAVAALPDVPTVPDATVTVPDFEGTVPTDLTGTITDAGDLPTAPIALSAPTFDTLPTAPTATTAAVDPPDLTATAPGALSDTLADVSITLGSGPTAPDAPTFDAIADMGDIPEITAVVPTIDISALTTTFSFTEPTYTQQISSTVKSELERVLGGDLGIPSSVWSAMWTQVAGDLARQQVGRLRLARNRGAASYWALPSETVLAQANAIADEGARSLQLDRLQKAVQEATMKREDFWEAVKQGLALEQIWIGFHENMAQRALGAAEQLANVSIAVYNANVQRFNLLLEAAKLQGTIDDLEINRIIKGYEMQLKKAEILVSETKSKIEHFQAVWEGYKTKASAEVAVEGAKTERYAARTNRGQLAVAQYSEAVKAWSIEVDGEIKSKNFELEKSRLEAALYEAKLKGSELEIQQAREKLEHWKGAWAAYQAQADTTLKVSADNIQRYGALTARGQLAIQRFGEEVRYWSSLVDAELKSKGFILQKAEIEAKNYATQYGAIDAMATATNALINGRVAMAKLNLEHDVSDFETEKTKNEIGVEVGKIAQAAQEAKARIDVAQAEWVGGQATSMLQRIAELSFGFSQAAVSASDVGLSSGTSVGISQSISASQNEDLAWEYTWPSGPAPTGAIS